MTMTLNERIQAVPYWYHKIELPDGTVTPGWAPLCAERYSIPDDLTGKRVLDIGAWDGYWTWEALKRGAKEVVAIDDFSDGLGAAIDRSTQWNTFDLCREAFGFTQIDSRIDARWLNDRDQAVINRTMSVYDITPERFGMFDVVFFFGTIYHLKHPLLALEKIASVCRGAIYVETAALDDYSPYRGGMGKGFNNNEMVMEFYPGAEYGANGSNWWAPTLQCLGSMLQSVEFVDVEAWPLTETPASLAECRGFASGTKDPAAQPARHPDDVGCRCAPAEMKVAAVMSVPRLGFQDNMTCAQSVLWPLKIPLINIQGAFWGQCLERGIMQLIDAGYDYILTIDYDTVFTRRDVETLLRLFYAHPEATALVPVQYGRGGFPILMSMKTRTGQIRQDVPIAELTNNEVVPIATGHFGLTLLRVADLLDVPHPWFHDQPNPDKQWGPGRIDADIWFWKLLERHGKTALLSPRVTVGHLELVAKWPDADLKPIYQGTSDFHDNGKPTTVWR